MKTTLPWRRLFLVTLLLGILLPTLLAAEPPAPPALLEQARRMVFLGDSITYSGEYLEFFEAWLVTRQPAQRQEVLNLGLPSETVSGLSEPGHAGGAFPRPDLHERLDRVLAKTKPDLVLACYGMNDGIYYPFSEDRFQKFQAGTRKLREKVHAAGAEIIHLTPPVFDPLPLKGRTLPGGQAEYPQPYEGYDGVLARYSEWLLAQRTQGWLVVDLHGPMSRHLAEQRKQNPAYSLAGDGVHPGRVGHWLMALQLLTCFGAPAGTEHLRDPQALLAPVPRWPELLKLVQERQRLLKDAWLNETGHQRPGMNKGVPLAEAESRAAVMEIGIRAEAKPLPGAHSTWNGFDRFDFASGGRTVSVIVAPQPLPGGLWAWKGEFLDAFPGTETGLLKRGVHLVYLGAPNLLGSPAAVAAWSTCHAELTSRYGLAAKPALIGLSRGGLYCYNWAAANPQKVACIYGDAPVCDLKSWPGGKGKGKGSPADWKLALEQFGFRSETDALAGKVSPIDHLAPLAQARVPLLHVYGDADDVVPWDENTGVLAERYRQLGGSITLIPKPGVGHHPHGLQDPAPVVEFIVTNLVAANKPKPAK
jgi:lysophospholipase L1-like esterase/pimeloyl-ACP methyl ester carboxylesterase